MWLYWKRFFQLNNTPAPHDAGLIKRFLHKYDFYWKLFIAFIPAAVLGLLFSDAIDEMLEKVWVVAVMLVIGGIFMLFCDKLFNKGNENTKEKKTRRGYPRFVRYTSQKNLLKGGRRNERKIRSRRNGNYRI